MRPRHIFGFVAGFSRVISQVIPGGVIDEFMAKFKTGQALCILREDKP
jgi:hypothetical protein